MKQQIAFIAASTIFLTGFMAQSAYAKSYTYSHESNIEMETHTDTTEIAHRSESNDSDAEETHSDHAHTTQPVILANHTEHKDVVYFSRSGESENEKSRHEHNKYCSRSDSSKTVGGKGSGLVAVSSIHEAPVAASSISPVLPATLPSTGALAGIQIPIAGGFLGTLVAYLRRKSAIHSL